MVTLGAFQLGLINKDKSIYKTGPSKNDCNIAILTLMPNTVDNDYWWWYVQGSYGTDFAYDSLGAAYFASFNGSI